MTLRESVKSRLTVSQRAHVRRVINVFKSLVLEPRFAFRRATIEWRLPLLPGGRGWRSTQPYALLMSFQKGIQKYRYREIPMLKHPVEIALYMQLIWETKPKTIFEIGSFSGGGAVWMGDLLKTFGIDGQVISLDLTPPCPAYSPSNVRFLKGDATDLGRALSPELLTKAPRPWLVIEDASHVDETSLAVLRFFDLKLNSGEYIIVEDGITTQLGQDYAQGPKLAITQFLQERGSDYIIEARYCDFFGRNVTGNPNGYLRKK